MAHEQAPPILVTGAAGNVGSVGRRVVRALRRRGLPVRAFVHREDERAAALRDLGAEVVVGDLTRAEDVARAMDGCRRVFFSLSVSPSYLVATVTAAAVAREAGPLDVLVNMSQLTVSQMTLTSTAESNQQRLHWLSEQALNWSGLPVVHIRPTVFVEMPLFTTLAAASISADGTLRLPFGSGRTSPVAAGDVADVVERVLVAPAPHVGRIYGLTGPRSMNLTEVAREYSEALGRPITPVDVPLRQWLDRNLASLNLPEHLFNQLATVARLHAENRYDRLTHDVETLTGHPAMSLRDVVAANRELFQPKRATA